MGKVGGINEGLVAHPLDGVGDVRLVAFTADEDAARLDVAHDIIAYPFLFLDLEELASEVVLNVRFVRAVEPFQAYQEPGDASLHEAEPDIGESVADAVKDDAGERDHLAKGMAQRVDRRIRTHII